MKKDIKKAWVAALRSGQYLKGVAALRSKDNKFCCLGVLCNLHAQAHPEIAAEQQHPHRYLGASAYLPKEVQEWAGISGDNPEVKQTSWIGSEGSSLTSLASLASINDSGVSFSEIADLIETQL